METLKINLSNTSYDIYIGSNTLENINIFLEPYDSILILSNTKVGKLYREKFLSKISDEIKKSKIVEFFEIQDGEEYKNSETLNSIYDFMLNRGFLRNSLILTLGGGVVCDMGGFAAATFMRGIDFIQIPTSLLAQVDASIGGKVAINHGSFKNSIGAFYQPKAVFIDIDFLATLPQREFQSGLGEVIKHTLIEREPSLFQFLSDNSEEILKLNPDKLIQMIKKSCQIKKEIVEKDEKELGERAFLNLGHTYAHALESAYHFKNISHGEAVAKGLIFELKVSELFKPEAAETISKLSLKLEEIFKKFKIDTAPVSLEGRCLLANMRKDKKNSSGSIAFIILEDIGKLEKHSVPEKLILKANESFKNIIVKSVIDMGTNSTRLLIAEALFHEEKRNWSIRRNLLELVTITRLGKGVNLSKELSEEAMSETLDCTKYYFDLSKEYGAESIKGFATSAVRDAKNRDEFLKRANGIGVDVLCISGDLEAKLSLIGNNTLFPESRIGIIDIGGGSTEFSLGDSKTIDFLQSYNVGAVRVSEMFFKDNSYTPENIQSASEWIDEKLEELKKFRDIDFKLLGVAGTITTEASVLEGMEIYDPAKIHLYPLTQRDIERNLALFLSLTSEERRELPGLEPKRADVIIAGTLILKRILLLLGKESITASEVDNLEGAIISF